MNPSIPHVPSTPSRPWRGATHPAHWPAAALLLGLACMAVPTVWRLATIVWGGEEQSHGPVLLATALWLLWRQRDELFALAVRPARLSAAALLVVGVASHVVGRSQVVPQLEVVGVLLAAIAVLLLWRGWGAVRAAWVALFVLLFIIPLPGIFVQIVTIPLKTGVSVMAEALMHAFGYPVARAGVILAIGPYQLLVADACAGLTSMFTLEALGLVYVNQRGIASVRHRAWLAALLLPISFIANVVRVVVLVLVTYHFGDAAGQGFVHGFAGVVLFGVATLLLVATDHVVGWFTRRPTAQAADHG